MFCWKIGSLHCNISTTQLTYHAAFCTTCCLISLVHTKSNYTVEIGFIHLCYDLATLSCVTWDVKRRPDACMSSDDYHCQQLIACKACSVITAPSRAVNKRTALSCHCGLYEVTVFACVIVCSWSFATYKVWDSYVELCARQSCI